MSDCLHDGTHHKDGLCWHPFAEPHAINDDCIDHRFTVDPSDPATIERAAKEIERYRRGMKHVYVYDERRCFCGESFPDEVAGKAHLDRSLAAAVLASLTDTGDNKEGPNEQ